MFKIYICLLISFMLNSFNAHSQNETMTIEWEKPVNGDFIIRPLNVCKHAYLFESDQVNFKAYYWVEYVEELGNNIHKLRIYEKDGYKYETKYYFNLDIENGFTVDTNDYAVESAISNVIRIKSGEKSTQLYLFNYNAEDDSYKANIGFRGSDKNKYSLVTALEDNTYYGKVPNVCKLGHEMDVWISVENNDNERYNVIIQDEFGKFNKASYLLKSKCETDSIPSYPFHLKYYHINTGNIYLIKQDWWLEKIK